MQNVKVGGSHGGGGLIWEQTEGWFWVRGKDGTGAMLDQCLPSIIRTLE